MKYIWIYIIYIHKQIYTHTLSRTQADENLEKIGQKHIDEHNRYSIR